MARKKVAKQSYGDPVFTWAFRSSQPRGGTFVTYETRLEEDGLLRCNCMGWVFQRKDKKTGEKLPRHCKHTDEVQGEVKEIMRMFKAGEALPTFVDPNAPVRTGAAQTKTDSNPIRHGRLIEF
jgi:hypothetical protein